MTGTMPLPASASRTRITLAFSTNSCPAFFASEMDVTVVHSAAPARAATSKREVANHASLRFMSCLSSIATSGNGACRARLARSLREHGDSGRAGSRATAVHLGNRAQVEWRGPVGPSLRVTQLDPEPAVVVGRTQAENRSVEFCRLP